MEEAEGEVRVALVGGEIPHDCPVCTERLTHAAIDGHTVGYCKACRGFLAENAEFADICRASNLTFIGPTGDQIRQMGDKATARRLAPLICVLHIRG